MFKDINKIVILSGGSGNDAILEALIKYGKYSDKNINIIVNAYDDGKSTGVCREVTNTLGVSDIRKNHEKLYKMLHRDNTDELDSFLLNLYSNRLDIDSNYRTGHPIFDNYIKRFFDRSQSKFFEYKNFNVMNIIYSQLYSEVGYEQTNAMFSQILNMEDIVHLNSFDNLKLIASTKSGHIITDEGDLVEWCNFDDKIESIDFGGKRFFGLNQKVIDLIDEADLIIISSGTFWSSLYPTLAYDKFYEYINKSKAKKLWIVNSSEDKDTWGVSSPEFYHFLWRLGLQISNFDVLMNLDSDILLHDSYHIPRYIKEHLGNINGKHNSEKLYKALDNLYG